MEPSAGKLWKRLSREERLAAATHFFREPPAEVYPSALAAVVKARHMRPQAARTLSPEELARTLASLADPGEGLASSLLVALHLGERRPLLGAFLDALGIPHEDGLLKDEADSVEVTPEAVEKAARALAHRFPVEHVRTYLNTLLLQDPERWKVLETGESWLAAEV